MQRNFISNLAFLIFLNLIVKPFWIFGIDRSVQNAVGADEYGVYFAIFNYTFLFHILLDMGINNFNNRAIAREQGLVNSYLLNMLFIKCLLAVVYVVLCFAGMSTLKLAPDKMPLLWCMVFNQILVSFVLYFRSNLQGLHLFRRDSLMSILDRGLMILICALLLWSSFFPHPFKIEWFVYAQTVAYLATAWVSFFLVFRQTSRLKFQLNRQLIVQIFKESYPFALLGLLMSIYNRVDAVMLKNLLSDEIGRTEAGIYAAAYRLLDAANMIAVLFATLLLPMFSRMLKKEEKVAALVSFSARLLFTFSVMGAVLCYGFQNEWMNWLYTDATPYYATIFGYLMMSFIAISSVYVYGTLLTANGSLWQLNGIAIGGVVLNIALNYYLIPEYKALGATQATVITQGLVAFIHIVVAVRVLKLPVSVRGILKLLLYFSSCIAIAYGVMQLNWDWRIRFVLGCGLCLAWAMAISVLDLREMKRLYLKKE